MTHVRPTIAETLISARLSLLQSKRLILSTLERRLRDHPLDSLRARADLMRKATHDAQHSYAASLLQWGSPATAGYWPTAYQRLAEMADRLSTRLRTAAADMPEDERFELAAEVEMLEVLVARWRESVRASIASVA